MEDYQWLDRFTGLSLHPVSRDEFGLIIEASESFIERFKKSYSFDWKADPLNLEDLDYDFYEFGGTHWMSDEGLGFTSAWCEILTANFGFRWMKPEDVREFREFILCSPEGYLVFHPWQLLWSIVHSAGHQQQKASGAWMQILNRVNNVYGVPDGWYPVADASLGRLSWVPKDVQEKLRDLFTDPGWFFELFGMEPYRWTEETEWNEVRNDIKAASHEIDRLRKG